MMHDIYSELQWRGLIHQTTDVDTIRQWLQTQPRTLYVGFDPTADSLHVGHLMAVMNLRRFQQFGHRPIAVLGGATGMIGDPSGKSAERNLLSSETIENNIAAIRQQMERFLDFGTGSNSALLVNNADWTREYRFLDFLRDVGKHFPVNVMLAKDSVKQRLENTDSGLSYTEFSYMLLQSYDFVHLYRTYGCELQAGGSDQWGNITAGVDLARRMEGVHLYGLTCPLLTKSDGQKMGKTESGTLWLDPNRTSPYHFYQYWINLDDTDVGTVLRYFTELTEPDITELMATHTANPADRTAQKRVAEELTRLIHGDSGLRCAMAATRLFFGGESGSDSANTVQSSTVQFTDKELLPIFANAPCGEITRQQFQEGYTITDALVTTKLATSRSEARRTIQQGGAYVNNRPVTDPDTVLTADDFASESIIILRSGKKRYSLLRVCQR